MAIDKRYWKERADKLVLNAQEKLLEANQMMKHIGEKIEYSVEVKVIEETVEAKAKKAVLKARVGKSEE